MKPRVSFIIPVRNDAVRLEACLRSIRRNGHAPGQIEIIVVDNGSTDGSAQVAAAAGAMVVPVESGRVSSPVREMAASAMKCRRSIMAGTIACRHSACRAKFREKSWSIGAIYVATMRTVVSNDVPHVSHCHRWRTRLPSRHSDHSGM